MGLNYEWSGDPESNILFKILKIKNVSVIRKLM
jgi:hypothetical protein